MNNDNARIYIGVNIGDKNLRMACYTNEVKDIHFDVGDQQKTERPIIFSPTAAYFLGFQDDKSSVSNIRRNLLREIKDPNQPYSVDIPMSIINISNSIKVSYSSICTLLFTYIYKKLTDHIRDRHHFELILSVPSSISHECIDFLIACSRANHDHRELYCSTVITEPVAAALFYFYNEFHMNPIPMVNTIVNVIVCDFGEDGLNLSVVEIRDYTYTIKKTVCDDTLIPQDSKVLFSFKSKVGSIIRNILKEYYVSTILLVGNQEVCNSIRRYLQNLFQNLPGISFAVYDRVVYSRGSVIAGNFLHSLEERSKFFQCNDTVCSSLPSSIEVTVTRLGGENIQFVIPSNTNLPYSWETRGLHYTSIHIVQDGTLLFHTDFHVFYQSITIRFDYLFNIFVYCNGNNLTVYRFHIKGPWYLRNKEISQKAEDETNAIHMMREKRSLTKEVSNLKVMKAMTDTQLQEFCQRIMNCTNREELAVLRNEYQELFRQKVASRK